MNFDGKTIINSMYSDTAKRSFEILQSEIEEFQNSLDDEHEILFLFTSFSNNSAMLVKEISYRNPNILMFSGIIDNEKATLVQNMSQLNFVIRAVTKTNPEKKRIPIGFTPPI